MTGSYFATSDFAVGRLGRVLCFSRQFQFYGYERAHTVRTTLAATIRPGITLLFLSQLTKVLFYLGYSNNRKPRNELRSLTKVISQ